MGDGGLYFREAADLVQRLDSALPMQVREAQVNQARKRCREAFLWSEILSRYRDAVDGLSDHVR